MSNFVALLEPIINRLAPVPKEIYRSSSYVWLFLGCISLYGYIFFKLPVIEAARLFTGLMLLAFFISVVKAPQKAKRDSAWYFVAAALAISIFIYFWSNSFFPEYGEKHLSTDKLMNLCLFFPVAWWLGGQTRNVLWLLVTALIGFVVNLLMIGEWSELVAGFSGERVGFHMRNPQHTAVFFAVAFMGWILLVKRIIGVGEKRNVILRGFLWLVGTILLGIGCVITQTRAVWIGVVLALLFVVIFIFIYGKYSIRQVVISLCAFLVVAIILFFPFSSTISERVKGEMGIVDKIVAAKVDNVPYTSIGIRVHLWAEAWEWIKKRPITGWGYSTRDKVIDDSKNLPAWVIELFGHFHNSYIEILLSYGLIGIFYIFSLFYFVARTVWNAWKLGNIPTDIFLFGVAFSIFWVFVNFAESYFIWSTGVYLMALVGGCLYTYPLARRQKLDSSL